MKVYSDYRGVSPKLTVESITLIPPDEMKPVEDNAREKLGWLIEDDVVRAEVMEALGLERG